MPARKTQLRLPRLTAVKKFLPPTETKLFVNTADNPKHRTPYLRVLFRLLCFRLFVQGGNVRNAAMLCQTYRKNKRKPLYDVVKGSVASADVLGKKGVKLFDILDKIQIPLGTPLFDNFVIFGKKLDAGIGGVDHGKHVVEGGGVDLLWLKNRAGREFAFVFAGHGLFQKMC